MNNEEMQEVLELLSEVQKFVPKTEYELRTRIDIILESQENDENIFELLDRVGRK